MKNRATKVGEIIGYVISVMIAIVVIILFVKFIQWLIAL